MLSIIQLVAPSWAALPDGEPAHWSYAVGESQERKRGAEGRGVKQRTMAKKLIMKKIKKYRRKCGNTHNKR